MITSVLITGGRSLCALDLAKSFAKQGVRVVAADCFDKSLCEFSRAVDAFYTIPSPVENYGDFIADLEEIIQKEEIDLVIPTCEEIFHLAKGKKHLSAPVFTESFERLIRLHNKWNFAKLLESYGLNGPETKLWSEALPRWGKWVVKPAYSRFGTEVQVIEGSWPVLEETKENPLIIQRFIEGESLCTYSVCHEGKVVAHVNYKPLHSMTSGAGICLKEVKAPDIDQWVCHFVEKLGFTGQIGFDFIRGEELFCIECNPRSTSGIHLFEGRLPHAFVDKEKRAAPTPDLLIHSPLAMLWFGAKQRELFSREFWHHLNRGKSVLIKNGDSRLLANLPFILASLAKGRAATTKNIEYNGEF